MDESNKDLQSNLNKEQGSSMCSGLIHRTAFSIQTRKIVSASNITKENGPFYCPECLSDAIVRKCFEKEDHFAHKANLSKLFSAGETQLHKDCKNEILEDLKKNFPDGKWEVERPIKGNKDKNLNDVVPDISGRIDGKPIVIEVQRSFLNIRTIIKRTEEYRKRKISILWIIPLLEDLPKNNFRPRLFEKFVHDMYFGRIFYWKKGFGSKVLPIHFGIAERYIEESTYYDVNYGDKITVGGYMKAYKTIKTPDYLGRKLSIEKDFYIKEATEWNNENVDYTIPNRLIFRDKVRKWWI